MAADLLARLAAEPQRAAVMLDVDGTLSPIVERPEDAFVPEETRDELWRLAATYALVACVSGRTGADAARMVGIDRLVYVGAHGLELDPDAKRWRPKLEELAASVDRPVEDKGLTISFHYRGDSDEAASREELEGVAQRARAAGLDARFGRKVLELRPPVAADKGTAVRRLLGERGLDRGLYAGDDTTDLDAFRGLDGLAVAVRVAVASPEAPASLLETADLVVEGTRGVLGLLRRL